MTVCSAECYDARKHRHWKENNIRRKTGINGRIQTCPVCGKTFETARKIYCSDECRAVGRKQHQSVYYSKWYADNKEELIKKIIVKRRKENAK
jgi:hypothetical protein